VTVVYIRKVNKMNKSVISVKDLYVYYKSVNVISYKSAITSIFKKKKTDTFEAVNGVSFEVEEGKILGIIGRNGSGKSTLLRTIAGIFSADKGSIDLHGRSVSLLSIGVGFQNNLTGRDNILLSGLLLGFKREEILENMDKIIEFSELGDFIDRPVRTYSSGMFSKLAFSITAILETDIILIDEVLSVGDAHFRKKSYAKMKELIMDEKHTVVIVSHSLDTLKTLCDKCLWLHDGQIKKYGETKEVITEYDKFMS